MRLNEFEFYPELAFQPVGGRNGRLTTFHGGKSDTPAPDPRLIDAQIRSLGIQEDALNRMMGMAEEMAPLQRQQLEQTIQQSRQLWSQSQEDREYALGRRGVLSGIQDRITQEASRFSESDRRDQLAGQVDADVAQSFAATRGTMDRDLGRMGINPNDGRAMATKGIMATQEALAKVTGRNLAGRQARDERLQLDDRAHNVMAGYPAMAMGAQGQGVATMGAGISGLNAGMGGMMAPNQAVMSGAGHAAGTAGNIWGNQNSAWQNAQAQDAAGAQAAGSAIGTIALVI